MVSGAVSSATTSDGAAWAARSLTGMKFAVCGKLTKSKSEITKMVTDLGGTTVSKIDKKVAAVISTKGQGSFSMYVCVECKQFRYILESHKW